MEDLKKYGAIKLIREEFPGVTIQEFKDIPAKDRNELGSAIARSRGLTQDDCEFGLVTY